MHFDVLVEDASGKRALDILIPKIVGEQHSFKVIAYRGAGHIPKNLKGGVSVKGRLLLHLLPKLLRGYGKTYAGYTTNYPAVVILVCDLDDRCLKAFRQELLSVLHSCNPQPPTRFCIAVEEGEAWLLGDIPAIKIAYPAAKADVLGRYKSDSICGTWELLADAVCPGGSSGLIKKGWQAVGREKSTWSEKIAPRMDVAANTSPSFQYFRSELWELALASPAIS